jgi:exodeoxyribonuclease VII small subunit
VIDEPLAPPPDTATLQSLLQDGSFEATLQALESVVAVLERGQVSLEDAVHWYEIGLGLSRRCQALLAEAELRVSTLEGSTE